MSTYVRATFLLATRLCAAVAAASPRAVFDREPNDRADDAEQFRGQAVLIGTLSADDVDMYRWSVDEAARTPLDADVPRSVTVTDRLFQAELGLDPRLPDIRSGIQCLHAGSACVVRNVEG